MFWKCLRVICMIIGISSLSHDSHPCNVCIDHTIHVNCCNVSVLTCTHALARCDVINTARLCGDFTSYPLKSVYLSGGEPWKYKTGEGQDVIAAAVVVWFQRIAIVSTDAISCCMKHNRRVGVWSSGGVTTAINHSCSMSFRGTRMTNCIRRSLTYIDYLNIKLNGSAKDALAKNVLAA